MSIVTKITWAATKINDRNLHKVNEGNFEPPDRYADNIRRSCLWKIL